MKAIENLKQGINIYNLGTDKGSSVLELAHAFIKENQVDVSCKVVGRHPGDIPKCYADVDKAQRKLNWKAELTIKDMVRDAWNFEKSNR